MEWTNLFGQWEEMKSKDKCLKTTLLSDLVRTGHSINLLLQALYVNALSLTVMLMSDSTPRVIQGICVTFDTFKDILSQLIVVFNDWRALLVFSE